MANDDLQFAGATNALPSRPVDVGRDQSLFHLRILATTDIHMQFLGYDYVRDRALAHHGLAGLATMVDQARAEARAREMPCVLFDNGDLLQGSALGDRLSRQPVTKQHPVVRCLEEMAYDALGIGNHDLDHGLTYPFQIAALCHAPLISSNLQTFRPSPIKSSAIIERVPPELFCQSNGTLRIGVLSVLPDQTALWNRHILDGQAKIVPARDIMIPAIDDLRQRGADIIILLAHLGIENSREGGKHHDDARALAALPGIDAVITGHTHRRLPGLDHAGFSDVDVIKSTLAKRPAVMPGFNASDLAVLDLGLAQTPAGEWHVLSHETQLRANTQAVPPHARIAAICKKAHEETRQLLAKQVGRTEHLLHNFFSLAMPTTTCAILAQAKRDVVARGLQGQPAADLPILATASAHTAGGRSGPDHFLHIPPGPILNRHLAGLDPYTNEICALRVTGADLRHWLEHSTEVYHHLRKIDGDQYLIQDKRPTFDYDTIYGLEYAIDPTRPAAERIVHLEYKNAPLSDTQNFVLATTTFRAAGGGGGAQFAQDRILFQSRNSLDDALRVILTEPAQTNWQNSVPWRFACDASVQAVIRTSPEAKNHLHDIAHLQPELLGIDDTGFLRIRLTL